MKTSGKKPNKQGHVYPESSRRQDLRGSRRAQGGPGITEGKNPQLRSVIVREYSPSLSVSINDAVESEIKEIFIINK